MHPSQPQYQNITITPLGAGQQVGRSCIVCKIKDRTIIFDTGIHMQYTDMQKYPDFKFICGQGNINDYVDAVIVTHFHLDHCGGLPYLTEFFGYKGPIYATMPTKAMIPYMLEDFRKVTADLKKEKDQGVFTYTAGEARSAAEKITSIALEQTVHYKNMKITPYYAGHVLGAGMFLVQYQGLSVLYTGDYNSYADRHLGAAYAPRLNPNIVITQTTYATTIRDTKRDRQRKMLKIVSQTVENGGKVLIPVFALGRAQQLSVLLQTYWNRTQNEKPVYFSAGLIEKANFYYKLFVEWENQKIREDFLTDNLFNFKKVKPFDKSLIRADSPYVLFATPGMLHGGTSLQVFKQWCGNPKNTIIIPGYCVPGTFGNKLLSGVRKLQIDHKQYQVNMKVQNISFSAHADAKGIINLIRHINAQNIVFVHGDKQKMQVFQQVVKQQLGRPVFRPANKQSISIKCTVRNKLCIKDVGSIPREPAMQGYLIHKGKNSSNKSQDRYRLIKEESLLRQLNLMKQMLDCSNSIIVQEEIQAQFTVKDEREILKISRQNLCQKHKVQLKQNSKGVKKQDEGYMQNEQQLKNKVQKQQQEILKVQKQLSQMVMQQQQAQRAGPQLYLKGKLQDVLSLARECSQNKM